MLYLGYCHNGGYGVEKNPEAAVEWFVRAAEEGNAAAAYKAGGGYAEGIGTEPDLAKAFAYYKQSAEANNPDAQLVMAEYYDEGRDGMVEPDARAAFDWYRKAADNGSSCAMSVIGDYFNGLLGAEEKIVEPDEAKALEWYRRTAVFQEVRPDADRHFRDDTLPASDLETAGADRRHRRQPEHLDAGRVREE